jgi:protein translocase SecG subunit
MIIDFLKVMHLIISILVVCLVLVQTKSNNFSSVLSGKFNTNRTKRGLEVFVFYLTIVLVVAFMVNSLAIVYLSK